MPNLADPLFSSGPYSGPILIAHRGASGYRPEHTLESYQLAIDQGADFIEPDLVMTKDGVLIARHENEIGGTTDVARQPAFADRRAHKSIDGRGIDGWFSEDFTLADIKRLRARERLPALRPVSSAHDGRAEVPTLAEILHLVQRNIAATGRTIGLYPELKHPGYFAAIGLPMVETLAATLDAAGFPGERTPVFVQCFEGATLRALRQRLDVPLVQLLDAEGQPSDRALAGDPRGYRDLITPAGLAEIAGYARAIGVNKLLVIPRDAEGRSRAPTGLVAAAHAAGLLVHPWTFRAENAFLPRELRRGDPTDPGFASRHGEALAEYRMFLDLGIDGLFTDFPDQAATARRQWRHGRAPTDGR